MMLNFCSVDSSLSRTSDAMRDNLFPLWFFFLLWGGMIIIVIFVVVFGLGEFNLFGVCGCEALGL